MLVKEFLIMKFSNLNKQINKKRMQNYLDFIAFNLEKIGHIILYRDREIFLILIIIKVLLRTFMIGNKNKIM